MTRRDILKGSLLLGGACLVPSDLVWAKSLSTEPWRPAYLKSEEAGKLSQKVQQAYSIYEKCQLCPRMCGVNRLKGEKGFCRAPAKAVVYSAHPHFGEEKPIVGQNGSGTIFFSHCNLRCVFCQNWPIAHEGRGEEVDEETLADKMLYLQSIGCHNVNFVTPTHVMPAILKATRIALKKGLQVPIFYNTSGYERLEMLKILDGVVDIYKPDMKYMDPDKADKYSSGAANYPDVARKAIIEMNRQVGVLKLDNRRIALRGLLIRHLVMPNRVAGTEKFVKWVAENLPKSTYINIMAQYRVEYKAFEYPEISRGLLAKEFLEALDWAEKAGLTNLDSQSLTIRNLYNRAG